MYLISDAATCFINELLPLYLYRSFALRFSSPFDRREAQSGVVIVFWGGVCLFILQGIFQSQHRAQRQSCHFCQRRRKWQSFDALNQSNLMLRQATGILDASFCQDTFYLDTWQAGISNLRIDIFLSETGECLNRGAPTLAFDRLD